MFILFQQYLTCWVKLFSQLVAVRFQLALFFVAMNDRGFSLILSHVDPASG